MNAPVEKLFKVGPGVDYEWKDAPHTFEAAVCEGCGEMVVERNLRVKAGKILCIPCASQS